MTQESTPEQIKDAYRALVKQHHPDASFGAQPDADKFRDVMEAFSVLSVRESRVNYDLLRRKAPQDFAVQSEAAFNKTHRPDLRDAAGNTPAAAPSAGSYAAERMAELAEQRKKYNANHLGLYRGGVPQPGRGAIRGAAMGVPGEFHQPQVHNFLNNYHQDSHLTTSEDAVKFKAYMTSDQYDFKRSRPVHPMYYDREFLFMKDRSFWGAMLMALILGYYVKARYAVEVDRWAMWRRRDCLADTPAHHVTNKGGVLVRKQFIGFEKYHQNSDEMMAWYTKAYPDAFRKGGEE